MYLSQIDRKVERLAELLLSGFTISTKNHSKLNHVLVVCLHDFMLQTLGHVLLGKSQTRLVDLQIENPDLKNRHQTTKKLYRQKALYTDVYQVLAVVLHIRPHTEPNEAVERESVLAERVHRLNPVEFFLVVGITIDDRPSSQLLQNFQELFLTGFIDLFLVHADIVELLD